MVHSPKKSGYVDDVVRLSVTVYIGTVRSVLDGMFV